MRPSKRSAVRRSKSDAYTGSGDGSGGVGRVNAIHWPSGLKAGAPPSPSIWKASPAGAVHAQEPGAPGALATGPRAIGCKGEQAPVRRPARPRSAEARAGQAHRFSGSRGIREPDLAVAPVLLFENRGDHERDPRPIRREGGTGCILQPIVVVEFDGPALLGLQSLRQRMRAGEREGEKRQGYRGEGETARNGNGRGIMRSSGCEGLPCNVKGRRAGVHRPGNSPYVLGRRCSLSERGVRMGTAKADARASRSASPVTNASASPATAKARKGRSNGSRQSGSA